MEANYIKKIIDKYDTLPYKCILFDGPWGIGKSYEITNATSKKNVVYISAFGLKSPQNIYQKLISGWILNKKNNICFDEIKIIKMIYKIFPRIKIINDLIDISDICELVSKHFKNYHYIIIDDLERTSKDINIEELFGVIEEIKQYNYVKVILVANTKEFYKEHKEVYELYAEKVIDCTYHITKKSKIIDWKNLEIHDGFITEFLKKHDVKNLRTLKKAQNLYDDIKLYFNDRYSDEFKKEIQLTCFAVVVETNENLYLIEKRENVNDPALAEITYKMRNELSARIFNNYLSGIRISRNLIDLIMKYFSETIEITEMMLDIEYKMFLETGKKPNFYKSDDELKSTLISMEEILFQENNLNVLIDKADDYFRFSEIIGEPLDEFITKYQEKLYQELYRRIEKGNMDYFSYIDVSSKLCSDKNKEIVNRMEEKAKIDVINKFIEYLSKRTDDITAYEYSCYIRRYMDHIRFDNTDGRYQLDLLYNKNSFPISDVNENHYDVSVNIMYILYHENRTKFLQYVEALCESCDKMANYRIKYILNLIQENKKVI